MFSICESLINKLHKLVGTVRNGNFQEISGEILEQIKENLSKIPNVKYFQRHFDYLNTITEIISDVKGDYLQKYLENHKNNIVSLLNFICYVTQKMDFDNNLRRRGAIYGLIAQNTVIKMKQIPYHAIFYKDYSCEIPFTPCNFVNPWPSSSETSICQLIMSKKFKYIIATNDDIFLNKQTMISFGSFLLDNKIVSTLDDLKANIAENEPCIAFLTPFEILDLLNQMKNNKNLSEFCIFYQQNKNSEYDFTRTINVLEKFNKENKLQYVICSQKPIKYPNLNVINTPNCDTNIKEIQCKEEQIVKSVSQEIYNSISSVQYGNNIVVYLPSIDMAKQILKSSNTSDTYIYQNNSDSLTSKEDLRKDIEKFIVDHPELYVNKTKIIIPLFTEYQSNVKLIERNFQDKRVCKIIFINNCFSKFIPSVQHFIDSGINLVNGRIKQIDSNNYINKYYICVPAGTITGTVFTKSQSNKQKMTFKASVKSLLSNNEYKKTNYLDCYKIPIVSNKCDDSLQMAVHTFIYTIIQYGKKFMNNLDAFALKKCANIDSDIITIMNAFSDIESDQDLTILENKIKLYGLNLEFYAELKQRLLFIPDGIKLLLECLKNDIPKLSLLISECLKENNINKAEISKENPYMSNYVNVQLITKNKTAKLIKRIGFDLPLCSKQMYYLFGGSEIFLIHQISGEDDKNELVMIPLPIIGENEIFKHAFQLLFKEWYTIIKTFEKEVIVTHSQYKKEVEEKIEIVTKMMPIIGRSYIRLDYGLEALLEIVSLKDDYYTQIIDTESEFIYFLDEKSIQWCIENLDEMMPINSKTRIALGHLSKNSNDLEFYDDDVSLSSCELLLITDKELDFNQFSLVRYIHLMNGYRRIINEDWDLLKYNSRFYHLKNGSSIREFKKRISRIQKKRDIYEFINAKDDVYYPIKGDSKYQGYMQMNYSGLLTYKNIASLIYKENSYMDLYEMVWLSPPSNIISKDLLTYKPAQNEIIDYLKENRINYQIKNDSIYIIKKESEKIYEMMENPATLFKSSFCVINIKNESSIYKCLKDICKHMITWKALPNGVIIPIEDEAKAIKLFADILDCSSDCLGCYLSCENPRKSKEKITIYTEDGKAITKPVCLDCLEDFISYAMEKISNPFKNTSKLPPITFGGFCPIGLFLIQISKSYTLIMPYLEYIVNSTYHSNPDIIGYCECDSSCLINLTKMCPSCGRFKCHLCNKRHKEDDFCSGIPFISCPDHPDYKINLNKNAICPYCKKHYCFFCKKWHHDNEKCVSDDEKECPKCHCPVFKTSGCHHITCFCGANWCYKCGAGPFSTSSKCYEHMTKVHFGWFERFEETV